MGKKYRLKKGAMPAKQAEQKVSQVDRAMNRVSQQGYPIVLPPKMKSEWTINSNDLIESVDTKGGKPFLIMWNPITSELLMASDEDINAPLHVFLHKRFKDNVVQYQDSGYDDWVRAFYDNSIDEIAVYAWGPLLKYIPFLDGKERRYADRLQSEGNKAFQRMLEMHGAGSHKLRMKSIG